MKLGYGTIDEEHPLYGWFFDDEAKREFIEEHFHDPYSAYKKVLLMEEFLEEQGLLNWEEKPEDIDKQYQILAEYMYGENLFDSFILWLLQTEEVKIDA